MADRTGRGRFTVSESKRTPETERPARGTPKRRIETQIHRRKKAKPVFPLEAEWDADSATPPTGLRMPSDKMRKK
ncbi:MAG: hypothetical protein E6K61_03710 [Nitrospirae bacterium]|nr:MAG: hypothetical protein AUH21_03760 [Nitrospirae bacterium 13_2_20CM_62_7]TLY42227.1 MAG: hypothetical protein E6K61_03710 [Nitrospirota bacterium]